MIRRDGRSWNEYREIEVIKGVIETAEGSALARIGGTQILAGIKFEVVEPFASDPDKGAFITNAELLPMASPSFEPGPPDERSIEFARVVDRGLRSAEVVDLNSFFIEEGKVLGLFLDLYVLDYAGNLFDVGTLAAMAALLNTRIPKIEDGKIVRGEYKGKLDVKRVVVSTTIGKIKDSIIVDPTQHEEERMNARLTVTTSEDKIVAMQKAGRGSFKKDEVLNIIDLCFEKQKELLKYVGE